jgi:hypothetical protein
MPRNSFSACSGETCRIVDGGRHRPSEGWLANADTGPHASASASHAALRMTDHRAAYPAAGLPSSCR